MLSRVAAAEIANKEENKNSYKIAIQSDKTVDAGVKNKFPFACLEQTINFPLKISGKVRMEDFQLPDFYQKVLIPGKPLCFICDKLTSYRSRTH